MNLEKLWLGLCPIKNSYKIKMLDMFNSSSAILEYILCNKKSSILSEDIKEKLKSSWNEEHLKRLSEKLLQSNIEIVTVEDEDYNKNLFNIGINRPYIMFYKGAIKELDKYTAAVVGSRRCTQYGKEICVSICSELARLGINIISGGAIGIDSVAHKTALENSSFTAAVLGSGIDVLYPSSNAKMLTEISSKGVLISEFPPGTAPFNFNFPVRNRIIGGIADIIIVVEAAENSGSCITGRTGADFGKDVIAVPGAVTMKNSSGCNILIQEGANIYLGYESIHNVLQFSTKWTEQQQKKPLPPKNISLKCKLLDIISDKPTHIDEIHKHTNIDISSLYGILFEMQMKNEIISLSGNFYAKIT